MVPDYPELLANALVTASIVLAARNSVHNWWTGIVGCSVFAWVFFGAKLYSDVVLQAFFVGISIVGWWKWVRGDHGKPLPVRWSRLLPLAAGLVGSLAFAFGWSELMKAYTDAASPVADALVLGLSVFAQMLMTWRRVENWIVWIAVNSIAVPLFWSRDLKLTAVLYAFYWLNAWWALFYWRRLAREQRDA